MFVNGAAIIVNSIVREKLKTVLNEHTFNQSDNVEYWKSCLNEDIKYMNISGYISDLCEFLQEINNYSNLSSRILCYDSKDDGKDTLAKKCDVYDESGTKITTIKIKRNLSGNIINKDSINPYKDVDILLSVYVETGVNNNTGRNHFRSNYGLD